MKKVLMVLLMAGLVFSSFRAYAVEDIVSLDEVKQEEQSVKTNEADIHKSDSAVLQASVTFDWLDITQAQRDENIEYYKNQLFEDNASRIYFTKKKKKKEFSEYFKDKDFKHHYLLTNNGVTEDEDAKYCAFFYKKNTLVMYAIQYKNNPKRAFYYTAFGGLRYTDVMSDEYPNFPYTSMQYDRKGRLKSAIYFVSKDLQYMYGPDQEFQGLWYKEKMYDRKGKQTLTRTNW